MVNFGQALEALKAGKKVYPEKVGMVKECGLF